MKIDKRRTMEELFALDSYQGMTDDEIDRVVARQVTNAIATNAQRQGQRLKEAADKANAEYQRSANLNYLRVRNRIEQRHQERLDTIEKRVRELMNNG